MKEHLKINVGVEEYVLPTLKGCLHDFDGKFNSTQNAVRLHEWLGGFEIEPPVLEAVKANKDGIVESRKFGVPGVVLWPQQIQAGWLLELEQTLIALPSIQSLLNENIEFVKDNSQGYGPTLSEKTTKMMSLIARIALFNANCLYQAHNFPRRMLFETLMVLDYLVAMVMTQRDRRIYVKTEFVTTDYPEQMFNKLELDRVIASLHVSAESGCYLDPEKQASSLHLLDESFYRQCIMAYSHTAGISVPVAYFEDKPTKVFFWAEKILNLTKSQVPELKVTHKPRNVVSLFKS